MSSRILDMNENARGGRKERKPTMSTCQRGGGNQSKSNRHVPSNSGTPGAPRSSSRGGHRTRCIFPPIKPILYVNCVMESSDEEEIKTNTHSKQKVPSSLITPEESSSSSIGGDSPRSIFGPIKPIVYIDRIFESDEDEETIKAAQSIKELSTLSSTVPRQIQYPMKFCQNELEKKLKKLDIGRKRTKIEEEIDELKENARALYLTSLADLQQNHPQANDYLHWDIEYPEEPILGGAKELLEGYTHEQACRFLAMMKVWATREWAELRELEEVNGHYAMFRVVNWNYNTFLAESCHTNLLKECKIIRINKEGLLRGDLIMVKELCRDHHGRWEARKIKLLERKDVEKDQKIVRTKKMVALALGHGEMCTIAANELATKEIVNGHAYLGDIFTPVHFPRQPCYGMRKTPKVQTPPLFPTVSNIRPWLAAERFRYQFFNFNQYGYRPTDDFIEFCGLLGSTTYRVIRNARSDDGVYEMRNVRQMGDTVTFDGDWNEKAWRNPTIRIGGRRYFARSYHETLKIKVARGTVIRPQLVWQDYPAKVGCLKEGFFMDLPDGSNGKIVIKAIYGGPKIPLSHSDLDPPHCYMANLLDSSPITVAEFASGKSRILVETAWKLAKKDPLSQHLLIVQDNSDAINLVHHLQNTGIEAMRYMSEDRWETIGEELTTQLDFPILLKKLLREIVMGTREIEDIVIEEKPRSREFIILIAAKYLMEKEYLRIKEMSKEAQLIVKQDTKTPKQPFSEYLRIYNVLEKPRIIVSTTDSVWRCLIVLKSVRSVQFDEAQKIPLSCLIEVCSLFPHASFGLMYNLHSSKHRIEEERMMGKLAYFSFGLPDALNRFRKIISDEIYDHSSPIFS